MITIHMVKYRRGEFTYLLINQSPKGGQVSIIMTTPDRFLISRKLVLFFNSTMVINKKSGGILLDMEALLGQ